MTDTAPPPEQETLKKGKSPRSKMMPSGKGLLIILGLFLLATLGGVAWWLHSSQFEQTDNATIEGHVHPVSAKVAGNVVKVLVDDNQAVQQGQLVAVIDPRDYQIALSEAEHNLANAKAQAKTAYQNIEVSRKQAASQITQAKGGITASQSGITQARQTVAEANAAVEQARQMVQEQETSYQKALSDYNRYRNVDPEAISAQQLETAATNVRNAETSRNAAQASLAQAQARLRQSRSSVSGSVSKLTQSKGIAQGAQAQALQVDVVKSQYESAKTAIAVAEDAVRQAKLNLSYTRIVAPASGRIGRKMLEIGQRVQPGEPLMSVVSPQIWIVANYKETQLERMRPGQPVEVHVDAFPSHRFTGRLDSFSPASGAQFALLPPENATGNFTKIVQRIPVKILLDAKSLDGYEDLLVPGMSTVVSVKVSAPGNRGKQIATQRQ